MKFRAAGNPQMHHHLHAAFDWAGLGKAKVVDVSDLHFFFYLVLVVLTWV